MLLEASFRAHASPSRAEQHGRRLASAVMVGALVLLVGVNARANGRYPLADQIVIDPNNPAHIVARATFGLLDSDDGGKSFRWICETAIGYFGVEDPPIAVTANGSAVVASSKGISVSNDRGCTWNRNPGLAGTWFGVDVTVLPARPHEALVLLSNFADGAYTVSIMKTIDDGATWEVVSSLGSNFLATTIEVAPSNPERVYVSGKVLPDGTAAMLRSDDGGHTWMQFPLELTGAYSIFIGAVHPRNPDVVYLRTSSDDVGRVLVSTDGAMRWTEVWRAPGDVSGFALSSDGTTVAVGGSAVGVSVATTADFNFFRKTSNVGAYCLTFWGERLLVCTKEAIDHFSIGVSDDLGEHFDALLHLPDVLPRACSSDMSAGICASEWEAVAMTIGADAGTNRPSDAGNGGTVRTDSRGCGCIVASSHHRDERAFLALIAMGTMIASVRARRGFRRTRPMRQ